MVKKIKEKQREAKKKSWFSRIKEKFKRKKDIIKKIKRYLRENESKLDDTLKEALKRIIKTGDVNASDGYGYTALYLAAKKGNLELVKLLVEHGAEIDVEDLNKRTPLYHAAWEGNYKVVKLLVEHGANINIRDKWDITALYCTIKNVDLDTTKLLVEHGADVNAKDEDGKTPLHFAVWRGNLEIIRLLIENEADLFAEDNEGIFVFEKNDEIKKEIINLITTSFDKKIEKLEGKELSGKEQELLNRMLRAMVKIGDIERFKRAIKAGANPFAKNNKRQNILDTLENKKTRKRFEKLIIKAYKDILKESKIKTLDKKDKKIGIEIGLALCDKEVVRLLFA